MKLLLNLSLVLLLLVTGPTSYAQWYGVKAGYNLSSILYIGSDGTKIDLFSQTPGYHVGVMAEIPVFKQLSVESGVFFSTKGYEEYYTRTISGDLLEYNTTANFNYFDIPLTAKASINVGNAKLYGAFGPYLGYGSGGEIKKTTTSTNYNQSTTYYTDIKWGPEKGVDTFKKIDLGLNAGAGFDFRNVQFGILYSYGLRNISENSDEGSKVNNRVLGFSMTVKFDYGSLTSTDSESRLRAVKRISNQEKLLNVAANDSVWEVRDAAFDKLSNNSLIEVSKGGYEPALIIAAKIRLKLTTWNNEFTGASNSSDALGNVIGAVALVNSPKPIPYDVVSACHKYIREGDATRIPELTSLLHRFGDVQLAEDYMNCGNNKLENAGRYWCGQHGYNVGTGNGSNRVRWGEGK